MEKDWNGYIISEGAGSKMTILGTLEIVLKTKSFQVTK